MNKIPPMPAPSPPLSAHLVGLPDDVISLILERLDMASLGRLARTCKKLRNISLRDVVWRDHAATPYETFGPGVLSRVVMLFDFQAADDDELTLKKGEEVSVLAKDPAGWWQGKQVRCIRILMRVVCCVVLCLCEVCCAVYALVVCCAVYSVLAVYISAHACAVR